MAAVWLRFRAELRTRWRAWLGLAVLVGLAGGIVLTAAAGARRTAGAYPRFVDESEAWDVLVNPDEGNDSALTDRWDEVARLPQVESFGLVYGMSVIPVGNDLGERVDVIQLSPTDERVFHDHFRPNVLDGRLADPRRVDEVMVNRLYAAQADLGPGTRIDAVPAGFEELVARYGEDLDGALAAIERGEFRKPVRLTVTGVVQTPDALVVDEGFENANLFFTPAFLERYPGALAGYHGGAARLHNGAADEHEFRRAVERLVPEETIEFQSRALIDETVERAVRPYVVALWAFAAAMGLTALLVIGQAIVRQRSLDAIDDPPLAAIGCSRAQLLGLTGLRTAIVALAGAAIAVAIAVVASPLMPIGPAADAELHPGLAIDSVAVGAGALVVVATVFVLEAIAARRLFLRTRAEKPEGGSAVGSALARSTLGPSARAGIRFAFESGRGRTAVPARTTLASSAVAVATVLAALTFAAGLDHLLDTPRLFGVTWQLEVQGGGETPREVRRDADAINGVLAADTSVTGWSRLSASRVELDGRDVPAVALQRIHGDVVPPVARGRLPRSAHEVALGKRTLERLGVDIGDRVEAVFRELRRELTVVGRVVLPAFGNYPGGDKTSPGDGAMLTRAGLRSVAPPFEDFSRHLVQVSNDADVAATRRQLMQSLGGGDDEEFRVRGVLRPADVVDLERVRSTPIVLAGMLALLGAATIAHALVTTIRRRRRELALLKTLGFTRGQVSGAIAWQASTVAIVAVVVGVPLGIAIGRTAWSVLARSVGFLAEPSMAWLAAALALPILVVGANLVAAGPAWIAARTRPAAVLRSE